NAFPTDPFFNLAAEEYLFRHVAEPCFLLWCNEPAVIVGRHQNALAEINYPYIKQHDIKVIRRLSGGGTVYHDAGNLNFSFIDNRKNAESVDFTKYQTVIIAMLRTFGIQAEAGKRNELLLGGKKISGTADHVTNKRILHHGTLLFSAGLTAVEEALRVPTGKFKDKAIQSVRSQVTNISLHLSAPMDMATFRAQVFRYMMKHLPNAREYNYSQADLQSIEHLRNEKYMTWEWNFGQSPQYEMKNAINAAGDTVSMKVQNGILREIHFSDNLSGNAWTALEQKLLNTPHQEDAIHNKLTATPTTERYPIEPDKLIRAMF
ncbi:MAG: lipoate--protein ligase family protein, partial [Bacteroidales bacterium]|nr:lipoate--protein ligase family protein [Bacteroidales bacterium]